MQGHRVTGGALHLRAAAHDARRSGRCGARVHRHHKVLPTALQVRGLISMRLSLTPARELSMHQHHSFDAKLASAYAAPCNIRQCFSKHQQSHTRIY